MAKKSQSATSEATAEQPYYLQRAHIKDFRSIRDAEVEFKPGLNIIIGPNGSGKTNFVRATESGISLSFPFYLGGNKSTFVMNNGSSLQIEYIIDNKNLERNPESGSYSKSLKRSVNVSFSDIVLSGRNFAAALENYKLGNNNIISDMYNQNVVIINHGTPHNYTAVNTQLNLSFDSEGWADIQNKDSFTPKTVLSIRVALFLSLISKRNKKVFNQTIQVSIINYFKVWTDSLRGYLKSFSSIHDVRLSQSIQFYNNESQKETIVQGIILEFKVNGNWLPFSALSSGTQRLFYIISEILSLNIHEVDYFHNYEDNTASSSKIIFLEEPELGIHPDQLQLLLQFLREQSKKYQLIITTHSPQVLDMLEEDELDRITICELHRTKGTQFRKLKKTQIETARRFMCEKGLFLSDYWRYGSLEKPTRAVR